MGARRRGACDDEAATGASRTRGRQPTSAASRRGGGARHVACDDADMRIVGSVCLWCVAGATSACVAFDYEHASSSDVQTRAMRPAVVIAASAPGVVDVDVVLHVPGGARRTSVALYGDDRLVARADDVEVELAQRASFVGDVGYGGVVATRDDASTPVVVALERTDEAPASVAVVVPAPFSILAPATGAEVARATGLIIELSRAPAADDAASIDVRGSCFVGFTVAATSARVAIGPGAFVPRAGADDVFASTCAAVATVRMRRDGVVDDAFAGGSAEAEQRRDVSFTSTR